MNKKIGVVGAGTMGQGIANAFATAGNDVIVVDVKKEWAQNGVDRINALKNKLVSRGKIPAEEAEAVAKRLVVGDYADLADADLIVEAAIEQLDLKKDLFKQLDEIAKEDAILASNTSSLSITEIGEGLNHPIIGMHFFNPADRMKLVEVISGKNTPEEIKNEIIEISREIGKTPVEVKEAPGFVVNRVLIPMINEASLVLQEGTATAEDIDTAMQLGANFPMGPLALGDLIGLDVVLAIMNVLHNELKDDKYKPSDVLVEKVEQGKLGRKTGEGFHNYNK